MDYSTLKAAWESGCLRCDEFVLQASHLGQEVASEAKKLVQAYAAWIGDTTNDALGG